LSRYYAPKATEKNEIENRVAKQRKKEDDLFTIHFVRKDHPLSSRDTLEMESQKVSATHTLIMSLYIPAGCIAKNLREMGRTEQPWKPHFSPAFRERLQTVRR
jgi:hypothetical protein